MSHNFAGKFVPICFSAVALLAPFHTAQAGKGFTVLYNFCQDQNCTDGTTPRAGLIADSTGNLYGTTSGGGANGSGTVFEVGPDGGETVLYSFCAETNCTDGNYPVSSLIRDASRNLYGTTEIGGSTNNGTVFKVTPSGAETVLYSFQGYDGTGPYAGVIMDSEGNLYGTTEQGGSGGAGTVFKLAPNGTETVLYAFQDGSDGGYPFAGLIRDRKGNLYGTTWEGGANNNGTVFKVSASGAETVLYTFCSQPKCSDGANPEAALVEDKAGNLYSTTQGGGLGNAHCGGADEMDHGQKDLPACGTLFRLAPNGTETVLYSFCSQHNNSGCLDGSNPVAGLLDVGNGKTLYGTTANTRNGFGGTVFKFTGGELTVLHSFSSGPSPPYAGVIKKKGYLYGTTALNNDGSVFKLGTLGGSSR
ncbi:MAG TPA: choice-of-anchor tandem repeat GloVer-containing protein [Rhizomicrobium sp.]